MCTAISYKNGDHYFGRTLDLEYSFDERIVITPRNYPYRFKNGEMTEKHFAIIGTATLADSIPLYYEATNEKGLSMAGLNFPLSAAYTSKKENRINVAVYEFIFHILFRCADINEAVSHIKNTNIIGESPSEKYPVATLHWLIADKNKSVTVECVKDGMKIYDNEIGVLTNEPEFSFHKCNLSNYMGLSPAPAENRFCREVDISAYSKGMGSMGLPGDLSSSSRFVRAAFSKLNSSCKANELGNVAQFFHIMGDVSQTRGCVLTDDKKYVTTVYTSCCNTDRLIYYYNTYSNFCISRIDMKKENLDSQMPIIFNMQKEPIYNYQN